MVATQIFFIFTPKMEKIPILTNIFKLGWKHQLEIVSSFYIYAKMFFLRGYQTDELHDFVLIGCYFFYSSTAECPLYKIQASLLLGIPPMLVFFLIFEGFSELHFHFFSLIFQSLATFFRFFSGNTSLLSGPTPVLFSRSSCGALPTAEGTPRS